MAKNFSERMGIIPTKVIQLESMDKALKSSLWSVVYIFYFEPDKEEETEDSENLDFYRSIYIDFLKSPVDEIPDYFDEFIKLIKRLFFEKEWFWVYDFIEFVVQSKWPTMDRLEHFKNACNNILEKELSGYRFVGDQLTPITNESELASIEDARKETERAKLAGVHEHLKKATSKFSDRGNPDYRNSIKESISAVEGICKIITGNAKGTLADALKIIENDIEIHPALKEGFKKIYGYTSDADGIRHALMDEDKCDFEDAKYMLVSCSAFINYLIAKSAKAGISF